MKEQSNCCKVIAKESYKWSGCYYCSKCKNSCALDRAAFIESCGWFQWYNPLYWCHTQFNAEDRDCTNWGMTLGEAYRFETCEHCKKLILDAMDFKFKAHKLLSELCK
jgi:hypothetical protein